MANILSFKTDREIAQEIADWIGRQRLNQNSTQAETARRANIAVSTYKRFEQTGEISLLRLISVLRALGRLDLLAELLSTDKAVS
ncbi:MAG TPA: helix-turn-helix domain-containing protein, partial [Methylotenera sp.]|nr:helix-turn-helix domain-containing protein [Methylotenera sp.]